MQLLEKQVRLGNQFNKRETSKHLLGGQLDELPKELDPFAEGIGEANLGDDPELNLVKASQEDVQIRFDLPLGVLRSGHVIEQFVLMRCTRV